MDDLATFLLARIAEDEAVARAEVEVLRGAPRRGGKATATRRWAECEAKRRIVELHVIGGSLRGPETDNKFYTCELCGPHQWPYTEKPPYRQVPEPDGDFWPCETLCLLALPYADHLDYRDEWRENLAGMVGLVNPAVAAGRIKLESIAEEMRKIASVDEAIERARLLDAPGDEF